MPDQQRIVRTGTPNLAMLPALVASLSLFESLGGVTVIAARLRELSSHLRAELVEAGFTLIGAFGVETRLDDATLSPHITGVEIDFAEDLERANLFV